MNLLPQRTLQEQISVLAQYLRDDPLHAGKNREGSNLRKMLTGLAYEFLRERDLIDEVFSEYDPNTTTKFIEEWEKWVGIPDDCLSNSGTLDQRRKNILLKLTGVNATTEVQFENIATILGYTIDVEPGGEVSVFPFTFPFIFTSAAELPFVIVVTIDTSLFASTFPLTFPFTFGADQTVILKCFLEKLKPANTIINYRYA